jgi:hypothetical protein
VRTVLEFNCLHDCLELYLKNEDYKQLNVTHFDDKKLSLSSGNYDWVVIRYNAGNQKQAFFYAQRFAKSA